VALRDFVDAVYADDEVFAGVGEFVGRIAAYGRSNALGQKLLQLTMPGVPDVYQGTELWDLSLVDPDNRRPVDFALRRSMLTDLNEPPAIDDSGAAKLWLVSRALRCRQDWPRDFAGSYRPVLAAGAAADHAVGFWRGAGVVALVTRLPFRLNAAGGWGDTSVELPEGAWTDALTGQGHHGRVRCADLFARLPVALLVRG
jgi:(1->4)-alpha-D-glucan 1-alpha-D-glucosylmutase